MSAGDPPPLQLDDGADAPLGPPLGAALSPPLGPPEALDAHGDPGAAGPSEPPAVATAPQVDTTAAALGTVGAIELATDSSDAPFLAGSGPAATTPPVTTSSYPAAASEASATERRDILVAGALLGAIVLGIGYRFATHTERPEPTTDIDDGGDSLERRLRLGELVDADRFIQGGGEIVTASRSRMNVGELVGKLYDAGATSVYAEPETPSRALRAGGVLVAVAIVVELPADDSALDPIVAEYAAWSGRLANTISLDELESHSMGAGYWRLRVDVEGM
jgi:hypothetical protein